MVYKCCVPECSSNYDSTTEKVSVFSFPTDEVMKRRWINSLRRETTFVPSKHSRVSIFWNSITISTNFGNLIFIFHRCTLKVFVKVFPIVENRNFWKLFNIIYFYSIGKISVQTTSWVAQSNNVSILKTAEVLSWYCNLILAFLLS